MQINLEQQSSQEKFNNSVEKLKEIFVQVMDVLAPVFEVFSSIAEVVLPAINFLLHSLYRWDKMDKSIC
jgi:hypothetical protein